MTSLSKHKTNTKIYSDLITVITKTVDKVCQKHPPRAEKMKTWYEMAKVNLCDKFRKRKGLQKQWLTDQSPESYTNYKSCRNRVHSFILNVKMTYLEENLAKFPELLAVNEHRKA